MPRPSSARGGRGAAQGHRRRQQDEREDRRQEEAAGDRAGGRCYCECQFIVIRRFILDESMALNAFNVFSAYCNFNVFYVL